MFKRDEPTTSPSITTQLASDRHAPGSARRALAGFAPNLPAARMNEARILVTELVTNSVLHAAGDSVDLTLRLMPGHLMIEVTDCGRGSPPALVAGGAAAAQPHGWGLRIVESLSKSWGVRDTPGRRTVWCELPTTDGAGS